MWIITIFFCSRLSISKKNCTFEHLPSSKLACNKELTLFVEVAAVSPLPTKPRALREPY